MSKSILFAILAFLIFTPFAARASQPVDIKVIFNGIESPATSTAAYSVYSGTWQNSADTRFTIDIESGSGSHELPRWNSLEKSFYISQHLEPGWRPQSIICTGNSATTTFTHSVLDIQQQAIARIVLPPDETAITCTFNNQYSESWIRHSLESDIKIITKAIGGDATFEYYIESITWDKSMERRFSIATQNGAGEYSIAALMPSASNYGINQYVPAGWKNESVVCTNTEPDGTFTYNQLNDTVTRVGVQVPLGYNRITCTFTIKKDFFVYVALGDSYQSGEGAGNSIADTDQYKTIYEASTYTPDVVQGGDGCHRALLNYAKINKNKLKPELADEDIVLIDFTCSGAKIERDNSNEPIKKAPIVGDMNNTHPNGIDPESQVAQALDRLGKLGFTAADVDLVTVGMGGNDAKFTDIINASLFPNVVRKVLDNYKPHPGEVDFLANKFATPDNFDNLIFKTDDAINGLYDKEVWAQTKLLATFDKARVLQLNYPDIVPAPTAIPGASECSGIRKEDLGFANDKIKAINNQISAATETVRAASVANSERLKLVDVKDIFGTNTLCPSFDSPALVNGLNENNLNAEVHRLLGEGPNGDKDSKSHIDKIIKDYNDFKWCLGNFVCSAMRLTAIKKDGDEYIKYLRDNMIKIRANLASGPESSESEIIRYDRSQGIFHPNRAGILAMACHVNAAYQNQSSGACIPSYGPVFVDAANGNPIGNSPIAASPGQPIHAQVSGFEPGSTGTYDIGSIPVELGTFTADANGIVNATFTLPDVGPGVHTITFRGNSAGQTELSKRLRVNFPGQPNGNSGYGMYLTGFIPNNGAAEPEKIDIEYLGQIMETLTPDEDGGVFVELPLLGQEGPVNITAKSQATNHEVVRTVDLVDSTAPAIEVTPESGSYDGPFSFNWNITDQQNIVIPVGVDESTCKVMVNDAVASTACSGNYQLSTGQYEVVVSASDKNGNAGSANKKYTVTQSTAKLTLINTITPANDPGKLNLLIDGEIVLAEASNGATTDPITMASGAHVVSISAGTNTNLNYYDSVIGGDCASDGTISLAPGDDKTCTITNARIVTGTLIIKKRSGTANGTFNFNVSGPTSLTPSITTINGVGSTGNLTLKAGQYTLSEIVPPGWTLNGLSCSVSCTGSCSSSISQRNFVTSFKMSRGMKITCTFTNRKK